MTWRDYRNAALAAAAAVLLLTTCSPVGDGVIDLLRMGSGFTAKTLCSGLFVSHRTRHSMWYELGGGDNLLNFFFSSVTNTTAEQSVASSFLGLGFFSAKARFRGVPLGCYVVDPARPPPPDFLPLTSAAGGVREPTPAPKPLPRELDPAIQELLAYEFSDAAFRANQTRALVVVHRGVVVGEGYQTRLLGIGPDTRLLGWSMTKTVHALVVGAAMGESWGTAAAPSLGSGENEDEGEDKGSSGHDSGPSAASSPFSAGPRLSLDSPVELADLDPAHLAQLLMTNGGKNVTFRDLLGMSDLLGMREVYSLGGDVPRMLFLEPDAASFAARTRKRVLNSPAKCDRRTGGTFYPFGWYYSSGLSNVLAKEFRLRFSSTQAYYSFVMQDVLAKIGPSFVFETDAAGTFVASSFLYATAMDFARVGAVLLASGGDRGGESGPGPSPGGGLDGLAGPAAGGGGGLNLPHREFARHVQTPHPHSGGIYSSAASVWMNPSRVSLHAHNCALNHSPDRRARFRWMAQTLPPDCLSMEGYQGQFVLVCPSLELVVVRLGLTRKGADHARASDYEHSEEAGNGYSKSRLIGGIIERLGLVWSEPRT